MPESPGDLPSAAKQGCKRASMQGFRSASMGGGFLKYKSSHSISVRACELRRWGIRWSSLWGNETPCWVWRTHAGTPTGAFGGAPYGATKRCAGCGGRMRAPPLGPSVELPMGPRNAVLGGGDACAPPYLDLRWSSLWVHETLCWVWRAHAGTPTGTFGGAPYGATKRRPG